jgi:hypothetical protein
MHLIIPYAASHALPASEAFQGLQLPNLQVLLAQLQHQSTLQDPEPTPLHLPHERLQAQALGWPRDAATLPWAAWQLAAQGQVSDEPQAWMTPCHWQVGMDQVVMADPAHLHLSDEESQQLLEAMQPFLQEDGLKVTWHSPLLWHVRGALLADLATASLDRVVGQNVKPWLPDQPAARPLQRLQSEMQMLLYNHPVNDAREARRQHTVNSFWLHGAGALSAATALDTRPTTPATVTQTLRASALHGDWPAWQQAWQTLDTTVIADALQHLKATGQLTLSLCSEHAAHTYTEAPKAWHQRTWRQLRHWFSSDSPTSALQALITP